MGGRKDGLFQKIKMRIRFLVNLFCLTVNFLTAQKIGVFTGNTFYKPELNPILRADSNLVFVDPVSASPVKWQKADVFNPAAIVKDGKVWLLYRCEDNPAAHIGGRTSRLGLAVSDDGLGFKKFPVPVLYPEMDNFSLYDHPGGCEDPRLAMTGEGLYVVAYTSWNNKVARLSIAFSKDLVHWEKKGPAFAKAYNGRFIDSWSKSGSMITKFRKGKQVLAKINGKYWMYWGEHIINLAWSENLYDWHPTLDSIGQLKAVISPRPHHFDSHLTECGPPAILTKKGITLIYNGKNLQGAGADPRLPENTYSMGQLILDPDYPDKVMYRSLSPFLQPTLAHETTGQYQSGTTFAEGMVYFRKKWMIYYGTADSFVGVAVSR